MLAIVTKNQRYCNIRSSLYPPTSRRLSKFAPMAENPEASAYAMPIDAMLNPVDFKYG